MAVFNRDPLSTTTWSRLRRGLNEDMDMVMESARRNNVLPRVTFVPWGSAKKKTHPSHLPNPQVAPSIPHLSPQAAPSPSSPPISSGFSVLSCRFAVVFRCTSGVWPVSSGAVGFSLHPCAKNCYFATMDGRDAGHGCVCDMEHGHGRYGAAREDLGEDCARTEDCVRGHNHFFWNSSSARTFSGRRP